MAFWRTNQPAAEVNIGGTLGHDVLGAGLNGMSVVKGRGAVTFKEVDASGKAIINGRQKVYFANEPFSGM